MICGSKVKVTKVDSKYEILAMFGFIHGIYINTVSSLELKTAFRPERQFSRILGTFFLGIYIKITDVSCQTVRNKKTSINVMLTKLWHWQPDLSIKNILRIAGASV